MHTQIALKLLFWTEDNVNFVYAPELELTGYGYNVQEAKDSFDHQVEEFLSHTISKNTLYGELKRLGWVINGNITAPTEDKLLHDNELFKEVLGKPGIFTKTIVLSLNQ